MLRINTMEDGWSDPSERDAPEGGQRQRTIHFTVERIGDADYVLAPHTFPLINASSRVVGGAFVRSTQDPTVV